MSVFVYRPVHSNWITQLWGSNKVNYAQFGLKGHNGLDLYTWHGEPVYHSGNYEGIMYTEVDRYGGIGVDVLSNEKIIDGHRVKLRYWHLKTAIGWDGKDVKPGDLIGFADNTGFSTGDHLHFGLKLVDKDGVSLNKNNGYFGALDVMPYYDETFIADYLNIQTKALSVIEIAKKLIAEVKLYLKGRHNNKTE